MTQDYLIIAIAALVGLTVIAGTLLKIWQGWLDLRRLEISGTLAAEPIAGDGRARIELADLRERVRQLEAIAAGVDL